MHHHPENLLRIAQDIQRSNIVAAERQRLARGARGFHLRVSADRATRHPVSR
jgi:hypothetical protein